jgi:hypothetical protein
MPGEKSGRNHFLCCMSCVVCYFFNVTLFQIPMHMKSQEYMYYLKYLKFGLTDVCGKLQYVDNVTVVTECMQSSLL